MISPKNLGTHQLYDMHISVQKEGAQEKTFSLWGQSERKQGQTVWRCCASSSLEIFRTRSDTVLGTLLLLSRGIGGDFKRFFFISTILWFCEISLEGPQSLVTRFEWWAVGCPGFHSSEIYVIACCDLTSVGSWAPHRHTFNALLCAMGDRIERVKVQGLVGWDKFKQIQQNPEE